MSGFDWEDMYGDDYMDAYEKAVWEADGILENDKYFSEYENSDDDEFDDDNLDDDNSDEDWLEKYYESLSFEDKCKYDILSIINELSDTNWRIRENLLKKYGHLDYYEYNEILDEAESISKEMGSYGYWDCKLNNLEKKLVITQICDFFENYKDELQKRFGNIITYNIDVLLEKTRSDLEEIREKLEKENAKKELENKEQDNNSIVFADGELPF